MNNNFMGKDGFVWWQGVVEDRQDPLYLGRCRVRILGWDTEDKVKMPTEELPWAFPIQPITSAAQTGVGLSPTGPVEGTFVVGFYRDGEDAQEPVFFGTLGGIPDPPPLASTYAFIDSDVASFVADAPTIVSESKKPSIEIPPFEIEVAEISKPPIDPDVFLFMFSYNLNIGI